MSECKHHTCAILGIVLTPDGMVTSLSCQECGETIKSRIAIGDQMESTFSYKPLPLQWQFHNSPALYRGIYGDRGSGKTRALCEEAINLSIANPGATGVLSAPTYWGLREGTQSMFMMLLRERGVGYHRNEAKGSVKLPKSQATILFRTPDMYTNLAGENCAWVAVDGLHEVPEGQWLRLTELVSPEYPRPAMIASWTSKGAKWLSHAFSGDRRESFNLSPATQRLPE